MTSSTFKKLFKGSGYQKSKNDRKVLGCIFVFASIIASLIGVIFLILLWDGLWSPQVRRDRAKLDSILTDQKIDRVEVSSPERTYTMTGEDVSKLLISLRKTNRVANIDWTKQEVQNVVLLKGTNVVGGLSLGEDGAWEFGKYGFRIRR